MYVCMYVTFSLTLPFFFPLDFTKLHVFHCNSIFGIVILGRKGAISIFK